MVTEKPASRRARTVWEPVKGKGMEGEQAGLRGGLDLESARFFLWLSLLPLAGAPQRGAASLAHAHGPGATGRCQPDRARGGRGGVCAGGRGRCGVSLSLDCPRRGTREKKKKNSLLSSLSSLQRASGRQAVGSPMYPMPPVTKILPADMVGRACGEGGGRRGVAPKKR